MFTFFLSINDLASYFTEEKEKNPLRTELFYAPYSFKGGISAILSYFSGDTKLFSTRLFPSTSNMLEYLHLKKTGLSSVPHSSPATACFSAHRDSKSLPKSISTDSSNSLPPFPLDFIAISFSLLLPLELLG